MDAAVSVTVAVVAAPTVSFSNVAWKSGTKYSSSAVVVAVMVSSGAYPYRLFTCGSSVAVRLGIYHFMS